MAKINLLGVPIDMGAGRRGVDMGASAIRLACLMSSLEKIGHEVKDFGNIDVPVVETLKDFSRLHYLDTIAETCRRTKERLEACPKDELTIILGGDHSISMGSIPGVGVPKNTGVIWIDAHTDINTPETSPTGNVHGMPLAHLLGYGDDALLDLWGGGAFLSPKDLVYIGLRSVDFHERKVLKDLGVLTFTMKDIDTEGIASIAKKTIERLEGKECVHVSFDADALDPTIAPGVGTPERGGLSYREAHLLMELLCDAKIVTSLDLVEVNPILDVQNQTAQTMVEMACSLFGRSIL